MSGDRHDRYVYLLKGVEVSSQESLDHRWFALHPNEGCEALLDELHAVLSDGLGESGRADIVGLATRIGLGALAEMAGFAIAPAEGGLMCPAVPDRLMAQRVFASDRWHRDRKSERDEWKDRALAAEKERDELLERALAYDLDRAGIARRDAEAVELIELRAYKRAVEPVVKAASQQYRDHIPAGVNRNVCGCDVCLAVRALPPEYKPEGGGS